jgi:hypothetical protein
LKTRHHSLETGPGRGWNGLVRREVAVRVWGKGQKWKMHAMGIFFSSAT